MRGYETLVVFRADLLEDGLQGKIERFREILAREGAQIRQVVEWGMRELAYPIAKQRRGYYVLFEYDAEPKALREFERNLRLADEVLRFVSVRRSRLAKFAPAIARGQGPEQEQKQPLAPPEDGETGDRELVE